MTGFFERNRERLEHFARVSKSVGARADYVQGGGGNTSVKLGEGLMAIKASGFCLKDIEPDKAYAVLDSEALRNFYFGSEPGDFEDVEKAGSAKAKENTKEIQGLARLRPSVEAGFHSVLDRYVAHSHSVYGNLAACAVECTRILRQALEGADYVWGEVAYADPGARLTFGIRDELKRVEEKTGVRPAAIFLRNHGLIVHHDDPDECLRIHQDVNDRIAAHFGMSGNAFPAVGIARRGDGLMEADVPFLADMIRSGEFDEAFFLETPLYPDQMVFLVGTFAFGKGTPEPDHCLADPVSGDLVFNMPETRARVIAETLTAVTFIAHNIRAAGYELSTMGEAAKHFIANWESEKYRKSLAGKKQPEG